MRTTAERRLGLYATFASVFLFAGLVLGRPELVAVGAPFAFFLVLALSFAGSPRLTVAFASEADRIVEGDDFAAHIELTSDRVAEIDLTLVLPPGIELSEEPARFIVRPARGERRTISVRLIGRCWGAYTLGEVVIRARDRFGLVVSDGRVSPSVGLRVHPRLERLQSLLQPLETQPFSGNQVARTKGEGIEFADLRPFAYGDRVRRINWRVTARRQALHVNESHPERNSDVVLFLDAFAEARREEAGTLDLAVRAAASIATEYLQLRDRVGLVSFGSAVRWLMPSMGERQLYAIVDALLETEIALSFAWKGIDVLPPRSLPPQALVLALSPLLDERSVGALLDLRARGFDVVVVDVSPLSFVAEPKDEIERLALRLWPLWRDALRFRYEQLGVAVVEWSEARSLAEAIEEVRAFRRYARRVFG